MNVEELKALKDRAAAADKAQERINRLQRALSDLEDGVFWLAVPVGDEESVYYCEDPKVRHAELTNAGFSRVCWVNQEPGLSTAVVEAVRAELQRRLDEAKRQYAEV